MRKWFVFLLCVTSLAGAVSAGKYDWEHYDIRADIYRRERLEAALKKQAEAARVRREKQILINTQRLEQESKKPAANLALVQRFLRGGAQPCAALSGAVAADNAALIDLLASAQDRCDWSAAAEAALSQAMLQNKLRAFKALTQEPVTCPEPFAYNPRVDGSRWHPLAPAMLSAVTDRCYRTPDEKHNFLKYSLVLLNPRNASIFWLGDSYERGIQGNAAAERAWLGSIRLLIENKRLRVDEDTLSNIVALGRSPSVWGDSFIPFETTRQLVILSLRSGTNGRAVLKRLDNAEDNWVWKKYSTQERWRISNLLEGKPEMQNRSWAARAYREIKNWF